MPTALSVASGSQPYGDSFGFYLEIEFLYISQAADSLLVAHVVRDDVPVPPDGPHHLRQVVEGGVLVELLATSPALLGHLRYLVGMDVLKLPGGEACSLYQGRLIHSVTNEFLELEILLLECSLSSVHQTDHLYVGPRAGALGSQTSAERKKLQYDGIFTLN